MIQNHNMSILEYIWLDSDNNYRSKIKIVNETVTKLDQVPKWNYDGSSTGQATLENSEVELIPLKIYQHKYDKSYPILVLCDTYNPKTEAVSSYIKAKNIFEKHIEELPMFGLEQEFFMFDYRSNTILDCENGYESGKNYCGNGKPCNKTRPYLVEVLYLCLNLNIVLTGMNYEVAPGQAEFQVCNIGIDACFDLLMLRFILIRIGEKYNLKPIFDPKPLKDENGSGCHINFSTDKMRKTTIEKNLLSIINVMCLKLKETHNHFIDNIYGSDNKKRLTGTCETSSFEEFTVKKGSRGASIRVPKNGNYFEDRRPASNIDPYLACSELLNTCVS